MNSKDKSVVVLKYLIALINTKFSANVKTIRSDKGGEFINSQLKDLLSSAGITHQRTCPYTSYKNGVAERKYMYILDTTRALKFQANAVLRL